jgi:hypothetical protein
MVETKFREHPNTAELIKKFGREFENFPSVEIKSLEKYNDLINSAKQVFRKEDVLKLRRIYQPISHIPTLIYVRPGTKELQTWDAVTHHTDCFTISQLPDYHHDFCTGIVFIDDRTAIICGGKSSIGRGLKSCVTVNVKNGECEKKCDMLEERSCHGVCVYEGTVYVFGNIQRHEEPILGEEYSISENTWAQLPDEPQVKLMQTVCALNCDRIFMSASNLTIVLVYDIQDRAYGHLQVNLPERPKTILNYNNDVYLIC